VREFLSARQIPFTERNVRQDPQAKAELLELTGKLTVPFVIAGDRRVVGYDPEWLEALVQTTADEPSALPPRDSAILEQGTMAARLQEDLLDTLDDLVTRIREELAYNAAKGGGAYRQGMHDGLRFAEEALVSIAEQHGHQGDVPDSVQRLRQLDA
jgi:glutaredoxin